MASSTRRRVSSRTAGEPFRTRETVATPTPACLATSAMVANPGLSSSVEPLPSQHDAHRTSIHSYGPVRILPRHVVVAPRSPVPDLPAVVRRLRRRRDRRPARDRLPARPPRVARRGRDLAEPDDAVAERRLGLRRRGLLRRAPGPWHARGPRRARGGGRRTRDPGPAGPGAQPHERPPPVVPGRAARARRAAPRVLRVGGRPAAEQLAVELRRPGVDVRR